MCRPLLHALVSPGVAAASGVEVGLYVNSVRALQGCRVQSTELLVQESFLALPCLTVYA